MTIARIISRNQILPARYVYCNTKRRTVEMTWGETSHTQAKMKEETSNKSSCFALTSIDLLDCALEFRQGILEKGSSARMCFAVCAPLQGFLSAIYNFETELTKGAIGEHQHYWLTLPDGQIIDPTADQFPKPTGEQMPEVFLGTRPDWYGEAI